MLNSLVMMSEDPSDKDPPEYYKKIDYIFLILYTIEMVLKILGMGFVFAVNAYLKDAWNILDFVIVISGYLSLWSENQISEETGAVSSSNVSQDSENLDLAGLRVFRVMRPLKTISSIKGLKVLMQALLSAIPLLRDTIIILIFFFIIFAIAGTQLLTGNLKNKCFSIQHGTVHPMEEPLCGATECPGGYFCGKSNDNPNFGVTNFDNLMYSLLVVF